MQKAPRILTARSRKKLEQMELMLLTHSPHYRLELHSSTTGVCTRTRARTHTHTTLSASDGLGSLQTHSLLFSSLFELEEWRAAIHKLTTDGRSAGQLGA